MVQNLMLGYRVVRCLIVDIIAMVLAYAHISSVCMCGHVVLSVGSFLFLLVASLIVSVYLTDMSYTIFRKIIEKGKIAILPRLMMLFAFFINIVIESVLLFLLAGNGLYFLINL